MPSVFDQAKSVSIAQVYERYTGNRVPTRGNCHCFLHNDKTPSLHLYKDTNSYHCFSCKSSGSPIDLVMKATGVVNAADAAKQICDDFGLAYDLPKAIDPDYKNYIDAYKLTASLYRFLYKNSSSTYFSERGFTEEVQENFCLGFCPEFIMGKDHRPFNLKNFLMQELPHIPEVVLDSYALYNSFGDSIMLGRYVFPITDTKGNIVAFSGRSLDPNKCKYYNTPETQYFKKRNVLYNYPEAKKYGQVYVVEGYCDALSLISLGFKNVVAAMGTSFTADHIELLKGKDIILAFDNDEAGHRMMINLIYANPHTLFKVLTWDFYKDFNEFLIQNPITLRSLLMRPRLITAPEFVIRYYKKTLDLSQLQDREKFWVELARLIGSNTKAFINAYPINNSYTPVAWDYYWTIFKRIIKGKRGN